MTAVSQVFIPNMPQCALTTFSFVPFRLIFHYQCVGSKKVSGIKHFPMRPLVMVTAFSPRITLPVPVLVVSSPPTFCFFEPYETIIWVPIIKKLSLFNELTGWSLQPKAFHSSEFKISRKLCMKIWGIKFRLFSSRCIIVTPKTMAKLWLAPVEPKSYLRKPEVPFQG